MKKGFTLIELLAVIVILAIIALIAVPTITGLVEKAKKGGAESSTLGWIDAIEKNMIMSQFKQNSLIEANSSYDMSTLSGLKVKGQKPSSAIVVTEKNGVKKAIFCIGDYKIIYNNNRIISSKKVKSCNAGDKGPTIDKSIIKSSANVKQNGLIGVMYMNPKNIDEYCSIDEYNDNVNIHGNGFVLKDGCMKWYVYKDEGSNYVALLDHNISPLIQMDEIGGDNNNHLAALDNALNENTAEWDNKLNPRVITAQEVLNIVGNSTIKLSTADYKTELYFYNNSSERPENLSKGQNMYAWLFDNTSECTSSGCDIDIDDANLAEDDNYYNNIWNVGYYTSTKVFYKQNHPGYYLFSIGYWGDLSGAGCRNMGIRPVITISKNLVKSVN